MKQKLLISLIFSLISLSMSAQVGEYRSEWAFGASAGAVFNRVDFSPSVAQKYIAGETAGFTVRYTCEKYFSVVCAFQAELNYARMGWRENVLDADKNPYPNQYSRTMYYLQLPLLARLGLGKERNGCMGYLVAGPQIGVMLGDKSHKPDGSPDGEQQTLAVQRKFDYGITAGLGLEISTKKAGHFLIEGRYYFGLGSFFDDSKKDPFARSANGSIVAKVTYLWGK